ncbi:signal-regulatory protein beta-1-like isoform X2 [Oncorhynchus masou masou]|uniref:signal-regulatory protein beta-1-like isoform X2 n=1 Tax=Oncorhynchus masou masou TaxID=90313 RepID=UPI00318422BD
MITLCLIFPLLVEMVHGVAGIESLSILQESGLKSAKIGDTMILHCFYEGDMAMHFSWYKQNLGDKLQLFSTIHYKYDRNATFYHEFKDNPRFSVQNGPKKNHLRISDMQLSDSGTYYCGNAYINRVEFGKGVILIVEGSRNMPILQQSVSESVQPGDSVTLNCAIHTETCAGEHSVYWFRQGSGESHPGIIYTHGDRSDQCEKSPEAGSPTQSCVYNLPKRNLSLSDAGTYYCAVALLFGNGTKLDIQVTLLLAWALYNNLNRHHRGRKEGPTSQGNQNQGSDVLNYAAVSFTRKKNSSSSGGTRGKTSREDAVYSEVRYLQQE